MAAWSPKQNMGLFPYALFKLGLWVEVDTLPSWVHTASDPPRKTNIPPKGSVDATFTGDSLEYKIVTNRRLRGAGSYLDQDYYARVKGRWPLYRQ